MFAYDPEFPLTVEEHEEMRSCIVEKLGMPIESEDDEDRATRGSIVCAFELGHEDVFLPDMEPQLREALRHTTVEDEPSFMEQLLKPFS